MAILPQEILKHTFQAFSMICNKRIFFPGLSQRKKPWSFPLLLMLLVPPLSGCLVTENWLIKKTLPTGKVAYITTQWESQVFQSANVVQNGEPFPCLAGRLHLFGPEPKFPITGEGTVSVKMFVPGFVDAHGKPKPYESWNLIPEDLKKGLRKDRFGWGYTLLLPWTYYRPDITKVELVLCYTPKEGPPLYSRTQLRLEHQQRPFHQSNQVLTSKK